MPHWHAPVAAQLSEVVGSQVVHACPSVPHDARETVVVQIPPASPPSQHPVGHEVALQTHSPDEHAWPAAHGACAPHAHAPVAEQLSAAVLSQVTHVPPEAPQLESERAAHVVPMQQPPGQDVASQMQLPFAHLCPSAQAACSPHMHSPALEHESARVPQTRHARPLAPHAASVGVMLHVFPVQHPSWHRAVQLLHAPAVHESPAAHTLHTPPAVPHAAPVSPVSHVPPLQHPVGQVLALQAVV